MQHLQWCRAWIPCLLLVLIVSVAAPGPECQCCCSWSCLQCDALSLCCLAPLLVPWRPDPSTVFAIFFKLSSTCVLHSNPYRNNPEHRPVFLFLLFCLCRIADSYRNSQLSSAWDCAVTAHVTNVQTCACPLLTCILHNLQRQNHCVLCSPLAVVLKRVSFCCPHQGF